MRGCSAQAVQSASSGEREHFEDAAAAISAADTEFVGLPSHGSQFRGACWLSPLFYCTQTPRWRFHCGKKVSNALSGTAGTAGGSFPPFPGGLFTFFRGKARNRPPPFPTLYLFFRKEESSKEKCDREKPPTL